MTGSLHDISALVESDVGGIDLQELKFHATEQPHLRFKADIRLDHLPEEASREFTDVYLRTSGDLTGNSPEVLNGQIRIEADSLIYRTVKLQGMFAQLDANHGQMQLAVHSPDTSLNFDLMAAGSLSYQHQEINMDLNISNLNCQVFGFTGDELRATGNTTGYLKSSRSGGLHAKLEMHRLDFFLPDTSYSMHPALISLEADNRHAGLSLNSHYYHLNVNIDTALSALTPVLASLPDHYLSDGNDGSTFVLPEYEIDGKLDYPGNFFPLLFPGFPAFEKLTVQGSYRKSTGKLHLGLVIPKLRYKALSSDSLKFQLTGNAQDLALNFYSGLKTGKLSGRIYVNSRLTGQALESQIRYSDSYAQDYLNITTSLMTSADTFQIHLVPAPLVFSYDSWNILPENRISIAPGFISFHDFELSANGELIRIASPDTGKDALKLDLEAFSLGSVEQLLATDTLVSGKAYASMIFSDLFSSPSTEGWLRFEELSLYDIEAGTLKINGLKFNENLASADISLSGPAQKISAGGIWNRKMIADALDISINMEYFDIEELGYLLNEHISNPTGSVGGNLQLTGTIHDPVVNGEIELKGVALGVRDLNNRFNLGNQSLTIRNSIMHFDQLIVRNAQEQEARLNGTLSLSKAAESQQDLSFLTDEMILINSTEADNELLHGLLVAQTEITIKGTNENIEVQAYVRIDESTEITYVFPSSLKLHDNRGVVEYGEYRSDSIGNVISGDDPSLMGNLITHSVNTHITLEEGTRFKLFFDDSGNNFLDGGISGDIRYVIDEGVDDISGMINIDEGDLHYKIPIVPVTDYYIDPGSYITISNDIMNPYLFLNASAQVRASTEGLTESDPKVMNFKVLMKMQGELNNLKLGFDISSETPDPMVSARIAQMSPEERNMNALSLLVHGSFRLNFSGDKAGTASATDKQIDQFYASQLNQLISDRVEFVDLEFDVQSYRNYGARGDLVHQRNFYYTVGKSFLDDRARINYKGSLGLTPEMQQEQINSQVLQSEIDLEINIAENGDYKGILFRKNKYEGLLEGEVIETGGGIRITRDYYSLRDFFGSEPVTDEKPESVDQGENQKTENSK